MLFPGALVLKDNSNNKNMDPDFVTGFVEFSTVSAAKKDNKKVNSQSKLDKTACTALVI